MIEKKYADYEKNGEIFCIVEGAPSFLDTGSLLEVGDKVSDDTHYVDVTQILHFARERHKFDTTHSVDDLVVKFPNLPPGTGIQVGGSEMVAEDGVAEIEFDVPGTYTVYFQHFQYLDDEVEVTVE